LRYLAAVAAVTAPVLALGFASNPHGFIENVVRFPLGLAAVRSPAASPLLGQVLTTLFPSARPLLTALLGAVGVAVMALTLRRFPPMSAAATAGLCAFGLLLATVLAPATRFGYLIYPANLALWALALRVRAPRGLPERPPVRVVATSSGR
jgi:hypothetical protein